MKNLISTLIVLLSIQFISKAQNTNLEWVRSIGSPHVDTYRASAIDKEGNIYSIGTFNDTMDLDPGSGVFEVYNRDEDNYHNDFFIQKLNNSGEFIWGKSLGGYNSEFSNQISLDTLGNLYIAGIFTNSVDFDPGPNVEILTGSSNGNDIFILKLDTAGNFDWVKQLGSSGHEWTPSLQSDENGYLYIAGSYEYGIDLDPGVASDPHSATFYDTYLLKLNTNGDYIWGHSFPSTSSSHTKSLTLDNFGNIILGGEYSGVMDFDPSSNEFLSPPSQSSDLFLQKLDTAGNFIWAKTMGGWGIQAGRRVSTDAYGNIYFIGDFRNTVDFDPGSGVYELTSTNGHDPFIMKVTANGDFEWAKSLVGQEQDYAIDIVSDKLGNTYITGGFRLAVDFNLDINDTLLIHSQGYDDYFLIKLDPNGNMKWKHILGTELSESGIFVTLDDSNNIYVQGFFSSTLDFDLSSTNNSKTSNGSIDGFIQKISQCITETTDSIVECNSYNWIDGNEYLTSNQSAYYIISDSSGCDSIVYLDLTLNHFSKNVIVHNISLEAEEDSAQYQWLDCENNFTPVIGENGKVFQPSINGMYAVEINKFECTDTSECITISNINTEEFSTSFYVSITPNPTDGIIKIKLKRGKIENIKIMNIFGQELINNSYYSLSETDIELPEPSGIYIIELKSSIGMIKQKIIKR